MKKPLHLIVLCAFALSACGGGGDDGGDAKKKKKGATTLEQCEKIKKPKKKEKCLANVVPEDIVTLTGGRLVLPAVAGNPAAAYFELKNEGKKPETIAAVSVGDATSAEMHETKGGKMTPLKTLNLAAKAAASFKPGGKHVMVFGLSQQASSGASVEITLTFQNGDKLSSLLTIEKAGAASAAPMKMDGHGEGH